MAKLKCSIIIYIKLIKLNQWENEIIQYKKITQNQPLGNNYLKYIGAIYPLAAQ